MANNLYISWSGRHAAEIAKLIDRFLAGQKHKWVVHLIPLVNLHEAKPARENWVYHHALVILDQRAKSQPDWVAYEVALFSSYRGKELLRILTMGLYQEMVPEPVWRFHQCTRLTRDSLRDWIIYIMRMDRVHFEQLRLELFLSKVDMVLRQYEATQAVADGERQTQPSDHTGNTVEKSAGVVAVAAAAAGATSVVKNVIGSIKELLDIRQHLRDDAEGKRHSKEGEPVKK